MVNFNNLTIRRLLVLGTAIYLLFITYRFGARLIAKMTGNAPEFTEDPAFRAAPVQAENVLTGPSARISASASTSAERGALLCEDPNILIGVPPNDSRTHRSQKPYVRPPLFNIL